MGFSGTLMPALGILDPKFVIETGVPGGVMKTGFIWFEVVRTGFIWFEVAKKGTNIGEKQPCLTPITGERRGHC
jgi:hypothetical protein